MLSRFHPPKAFQRLSVSSVLSPLSRRAPVIQFHRTLFGQETPAGPPPLPKEDQEEFERLQKLAQTSDIIESYNELAKENEDKEKIKQLLKTKQTSDIGQINVFKTIPEFEGDVNPETGEIGGPKQDPLRHGDYSFNGRVTDF